MSLLCSWRGALTSKEDNRTMSSFGRGRGFIYCNIKKPPWFECVTSEPPLKDDGVQQVSSSPKHAHPSPLCWSARRLGSSNTNANTFQFKMDGRTLTGGKPNTFLSGLVEFCVNLVSCFSRDADTLCVSIGLGSLSALCLLLSSCLWVTSELSSCSLRMMIRVWLNLLTV